MHASVIISRLYYPTFPFFFLSFLDPIYFVQSRPYFHCSHPPLRARHLVHLQSEDAPCTGDRDQLSITDLNPPKE